MIPSHLVPEFDPCPDPQAVIKFPNFRITVLTPRLFRIEYSPFDQFEDRPSQVFWYRNHTVPDYQVEKINRSNDDGSGAIIKVSTTDLVLLCEIGQKPSPKTLSIRIISTNHTWHFGDINPGNLKGTYRTLDNRQGQVELEDGLLSKNGWTLIDDSTTLVFNHTGWLEPRNEVENYLDLYFFGYGLDYQACISDFRLISGSVPLLPRWALGNWWSRFWEYNQQQIMDLIKEFQDHEVPLSVFIIDMDWHITETGNESSGWTGYTWNKTLFPDPKKLISDIHLQGLKTALNLHPASGIYPHEEQYPIFASHMGIDPNTLIPIPFDLADPKFAVAYFKFLHHPLEEEGIDFWWIDWQQGNKSSIDGLDPLWWLNHLHFFDIDRPKKDGKNFHRIRPFIFSRWGGLGNHRYPIGFSGDTIVSWDSLAYQPYFTSTASNVCYGWWSHDIGGHMGGIEDPELFTRWVQYGVLSPIFRLHSTKNQFHERRPFAYDSEVSRLTGHAMRLRHSLLPYLYTMAWQDHKTGYSLIRPMYHLAPHEESAYHTPETYTFGTELIAAPHTRPIDPETRLSRQKIWLPDGSWFNFFTGEQISPGHQVVFGDLSHVPLYAKAGAIIPSLPLSNWGGLETAKHLRINIFPGEDNHFTLYDDDGNSNEYLRNKYALTPFKLINHSNHMEFFVGPSTGFIDLLPTDRSYELKLLGINEPDTFILKINHKNIHINPEYNPKKKSLIVPLYEISPSDHIHIIIDNQNGLLHQQDQFFRTLEKCKDILFYLPIESYLKSQIVEMLPEIIHNPELLTRARPSLTEKQLRVLLETITRTGIHRNTNNGEDTIYLWNENPIQESFQVNYHLTVNQLSHGYYDHPFHYERGPVPNFKVFQPQLHFLHNPWELRIIYGDVLTVRFTSDDRRFRY